MGARRGEEVEEEEEEEGEEMRRRTRVNLSEWRAATSQTCGNVLLGCKRGCPPRPDDTPRPCCPAAGSLPLLSMYYCYYHWVPGPCLLQCASVLSLTRFRCASHLLTTTTMTG